MKATDFTPDEILGRCHKIEAETSWLDYASDPVLSSPGALFVLANEIGRLRAENRKLRASDSELRRRISETVGQLKLAVEVMEARDRV